MTIKDKLDHERQSMTMKDATHMHTHTHMHTDSLEDKNHVRRNIRESRKAQNVTSEESYLENK